MKAQRREVLDRPFIGELEADVRGVELRHRQLPAARLAHRIFRCLSKGALRRKLGQVFVRGQQVVLQAQSPFVARLQVDRDAQRPIGVGEARGLRRSPDQASPDEILVLIAGFEAVGTDPPRVQIGPSLPRSVADLEQVGEVAFERDLEQHRDRRARVRMESEVLVHLVKADQSVHGHGDAGLAHVAIRAADPVGDHVPSRVAERQANGSHRVGLLAIEPQLMSRDEAGVGRVKAVIAVVGNRDVSLLVGDEERCAVVDLDGGVRVDGGDERSPRRHVRLTVGEQSGWDCGGRRFGARDAVTPLHGRHALR